eukprot:TRINITY_DN695_c0_g1_i6.p1 TRINITY_DN695_c0_g1~~TRINITY_DN695_c0_g1_i6.p1  ORF type:complete len:185 (-),score=47.22 TRINITY_DN695_c0_g1_i6:69-623(-)
MKYFALILIFLAFSAMQCHEDHEGDHEGEEGHVHEEPTLSEVEKDGDLWILTDDNFDQLVMKSEKPFFIKFFAPWCGHCKRMHPDWVNLASEVKDIVTIAQVDCTVHKNICSKFGVRGYPTLKFLPEGEKAVEKAIDYRQARTVDAWKAFIMENIKVEEEVKEEEVKEEEVKEEEVKEEEKQDL